MITEIICQTSLNPDYNLAAAAMWSAVGFLIGGATMNEYWKHWKRTHHDHS